MKRVRSLPIVLALVMLTAGCTPPGLPEPIAPTGAATTPIPPPAAGAVVIGLDGSAGRISGFNPYAIADYSPAAQATATLVLPSAFVIAADGTSAIDPDVVDRAEVTSQDPFTVTYTLDRAASWSDGTPITAEDFSYLRDELLVQPGTVDPAGYQLITQIRSRDAGKTVEVEFSDQFPDWQTLFSPLLPSHLMKDSPGGWGAALASDIPVSANRYRMTSYDPVTGQISLARNDKYWGTPPGPAAVVLRLGDPADLLAAFTRGDVQALWFAPDAGMAATLDEAVPADRRTIVPAPTSVQLVFNTTTGATAERDVRAGIAAGLDTVEVADELTGSWPDGGAGITSQVHLPSEQSADVPDQTPQVGEADSSAARELLVRAGFGGDGLYLARAGELLRLTLGYPSGDPRMAAAARSIQQQLGALGIEVDLVPDAAPTLVQTQVATGSTDLALVSVPRGPSAPVSGMSAFGCPLDSVLGLGSTITSTPRTTPGETEAGSVDPGGSTTTDLNPGDPDPADPDSTDPDSTRPETTDPETTDPDPADAETPLPRTGNLSGYCEPTTQQQLTAAITGERSVDDADPALWSDLPVLPFIQPAAVFAVSDSLRSVLQGPQAGWVWTGPLAGLSVWPAT